MISISLALCLLISCFSMLSASAADSFKAQTGGKTISIDVSNCDTPDVPTSWYLWSWADGQNGRLINGHGEDAKNVYFDDCEDNIVVVRCPWGETPNENWSNVWNQSGDAKIKGSHATVYWGDGEGAPLRVEWSGDMPSDNGGNGYNEGGNSSGTDVCYLNPAGFGSGESWYAWTWSSGSTGTWVEGVESGGLIRFDGLSEMVVFASASGYPQEDWSNVSAQTADLTKNPGETFTVTGTGMGEYRTSYEGEWGSTPNENQNTNPAADNPWSHPTPSTEPYVQPGNKPAATPQAASLTAEIKLNSSQIKKQFVTKDELTVSYKLTCAQPLVDAQATLYYDSTKLSLQSWSFPVIDRVVIDNLNATPNAACFNFSSPVKPFDFSSGEVLVSAKFKVLSGASGNAAINLQVEELDTTDEVLVANSVVTQAGVAVVNSMKNVTLTESGNRIYSSSGDKTVTTAKKNPLTLKAKTKAVKAKKLKKKSVSVKPLTIKNAKGNVKVVKVKKGSSKKLYKKIKVASKNGKITIKKGKYKKGTYKIKLKVTAFGNSTYKKATKTKVVKIKIK